MPLNPKMGQAECLIRLLGGGEWLERMRPLANLQLSTSLMTKELWRKREVMPKL